MKYWLTVCITLSLCLAHAPAFAEPPDYGRGFDVYTTSSGIALSGNMLLLTWPAGANQAERFLVSVDVSDPAAPRIAGTLDLPAFVRGVAVAGDRLYAAADTLGVYTVDIANPTAPRLLRHTPAPAGCVGRIRLHGAQAYLAAGNILAVTLSLADPAQPHWLGATADRGVMSPFYGGYAHDLAVVERVDAATGGKQTLAVAADGESGLIVADLTRPDAPRFLGAVLSEGLGGATIATGLALDGKTVYLVDQSFGLRLVDISRPETPAQIGKGLPL